MHSKNAKLEFKRGELRALSEQCGISYDFARQIACGMRRPSIDVAIRISHATEGRISVEKLMRPEQPWPLMARLYESDPLAEASERLPDSIHALALERWLNREEAALDAAARASAPPPEQAATG